MQESVWSFRRFIGCFLVATSSLGSPYRDHVVITWHLGWFDVSTTHPWGSLVATQYPPRCGRRLSSTSCIIGAWHVVQSMSVGGRASDLGLERPWYPRSYNPGCWFVWCCWTPRSGWSTSIILWDYVPPTLCCYSWSRSSSRLNYAYNTSHPPYRHRSMRSCRLSVFVSATSQRNRNFD